MKHAIVAATLLFTFAPAVPAQARETVVREYTRRDGTTVREHFRESGGNYKASPEEQAFARGIGSILMGLSGRLCNWLFSVIE